MRCLLTCNSLEILPPGLCFYSWVCDNMDTWDLTSKSFQIPSLKTGSQFIKILGILSVFKKLKSFSLLKKFFYNNYLHGIATHYLTN